MNNSKGEDSSLRCTAKEHPGATEHLSRLNLFVLLRSFSSIDRCWSPMNIGWREENVSRAKYSATNNERRKERGPPIAINTCKYDPEWEDYRWTKENESLEDVMSENRSTSREDSDSSDRDRWHRYSSRGRRRSMPGARGVPWGGTRDAGSSWSEKENECRLTSVTKWRERETFPSRLIGSHVRVEKKEIGARAVRAASWR